MSEEVSLWPKVSKTTIITAASLALLGVFSYTSYSFLSKQKKSLTVKGIESTKDNNG